jgi:hypothetical protein
MAWRRRGGVASRRRALPLGHSPLLRLRYSRTHLLSYCALQVASRGVARSGRGGRVVGPSRHLERVFLFACNCEHDKRCEITNPFFLGLVMVDSAVITWPVRTPALFPALLHALALSDRTEPIRLLVLGCGCVRSAGAIPELVELSALLHDFTCSIDVVDHNPDVVRCIDSRNWLSSYTLPESCDLEATIAAPSELLTQLRLSGMELQRRASLLESASSACASNAGEESGWSELRALCLQLVRARAAHIDGRRLTLTDSYRRHTVRGVLADFEELFVGSGSNELAETERYDAIIALNSLWFVTARPGRDAISAQFGSAILARLQPGGSLFIDEQAARIFAECAPRDEGDAGDGRPPAVMGIRTTQWSRGPQGTEGLLELTYACTD